MTLEQKVSGLSNNTNLYPVIPDARSKGAVSDTVGDQLFDSFWKRIYWYSTGFESLSNFNLTNIGGGGAAFLLGSVNIVAAAGSSGNQGELTRLVSPNDAFSFAQESQFRTQVYFNVSTTMAAQTIYITMGSALSESYGFKILNSTLYGMAAQNNVVTTKQLPVTLNTTDIFELEAHLYPGQKVEFFVNQSPVGTISTTIPKTASTIFLDLYISTQSASAKDFGVYFFNYLQKRVV